MTETKNCTCSGDCPVHNERKKAVFTFGSNEQGYHGAGAAQAALKSFGAKWGAGEGHVGNSYAIPTRSAAGGNFVSLPLLDIKENVKKFIEYAKANPGTEFQVTAIGTGHAGYQHGQMAFMFEEAPGNCSFDSKWAHWLPGKRFWGTF